MVPQGAVEIHSEYRGYSYIMVANKMILIVNPGARVTAEIRRR